MCCILQRFCDTAAVGIGAVRRGAIRCGAVRCGAVRCGAVWVTGRDRSGLARNGPVWSGLVWSGLVWSGLVWSGRSGVERCGISSWRRKRTKNERVKCNGIEYLCSSMSSTPVSGRWGGVGGWILARGLCRGERSSVFCLLSSVFCLKLDPPFGGDERVEIDVRGCLCKERRV